VAARDHGDPPLVWSAEASCSLRTAATNLAAHLVRAAEVSTHLADQPRHRASCCRAMTAAAPRTRACPGTMARSAPAAAGAAMGG
jgi:hypothetical protein